MEWFLEGLKIGIEQMTWLEAIAVFFGLLSVWYAKQENILVYPTGIISVVIYVYICFGARLYADMGINAYYFIMSVYGWIVWSGRENDKPAVPISFNTRRENLYSLLLFIVSYLVLFYSLKNHTDSDVPSWDAFTTAIFFVGMWLMAKKKVENWVAWIIGDLVSIPLYFYKGLILTSVQFMVFTALAIAGLISWMNAIKQKQAVAG